MSNLILYNGATYVIPDPDDLDWGQNVTDYLDAIPDGCLQKIGGAFTLTNDVDFGVTHGLKAAFFAGRDALIASAGTVRLSNTETIRWRNFANSGNNVLGTNASDQLTYNGSPLEFNALANAHIFVGNVSNVATDVAVTGDIGITNAGVTSIQSGAIVNAQINASAAIAYSKLNLTGQIVNADIFSGAAIAYSKLNLSGSIVNADVNASAAIAYSKLSLTGSIVNADINASAAIALSKLATVTANRVLLSDASGFVSASTVTNTTLGFLDATSSIQTQLNGKQATGNYLTALTGDITASGPGSAASTLATVNANVGTFTLATITVNAKGLITAASTGSAGSGTVTNVSGTTNQITSTNPTTTPVLALANPLTLPGAMTAGGAIAMGANKITGLANGTVSTDAAAFGQLFTGFQAPVQAVTTSSTSNSTTSFVNTSLSASITPTSSSHRIKISMSGSILSSDGTMAAVVTIARGSTNLAGANGFTFYNIPVGAINLTSPVAICFIDSPATTSSTTYNVQVRSDTAAHAAIFNQGAQTAVIILEEIV